MKRSLLAGLKLICVQECVQLYSEHTVQWVCGLSSMNCWENETRETAFGKLWNPALKQLRLWTPFSCDWFLKIMRDSSRFCPKLLSRALRLSRHQTIPNSVSRRHWRTFIKCLLWLDTLLNNHKHNINHFNLKPTSAIEMLEYHLNNVILSWYYCSYYSFSSSKWGVWE